MGYKHSADDLLDAARILALEAGIQALTFRAVGARAGVSDRTVVYYFPTKEALVARVAEALGDDLRALLDEAFGTRPLPPLQLIGRAWPALTTDEADRIFALVFEMIGLASSGRAPYDSITSALTESWIAWLAPRTDGATAAARRRQALSIVAVLDGLLLLRNVAGGAAADAAVKELGATFRRRPSTVA